jgi:Helicase HerA, central domain
MSEQEPVKKYPVQQSATFAVSTATMAGLIDVLAHLGPTGLLVSGLAGYVAWKHGPELYEYVHEQWRDTFPSAAPSDDAPLATEEQGQAQERTRSFWDKAFGLPPQEASRQSEASEGGPGESDPDAEGEAYEDDGCLFLGSTLRPHADSIFSNRLVILGMPGAGKSNAVAVLAEELGQFDAPLITFDRKPEYGPLCAEPYLTRPYRAGAHNLTPENAYAFGQRVMRERLHVVVDLASYQSDVSASLIMVNLIDSVSKWQELLANEQRLPCTFVLEEAHYWLPESEGLSTIRGVKSKKTGEPLLSRLQQTFFNLANVGRSFGMGLIVSTQRPANVDKRLIAVAEWRLLLKALEPADLRVYRGFGLDGEQAMSLDSKQGEAYVIGPGVKGVHRIRRRYSPDEAKTPGLANIRNANRQEQMASHYSPFPPSPARDDVEHVNPVENASPVKGEDGVNAPGKPVNASVNGSEYSQGLVNTSLDHSPVFTSDEEIQVLLTYAELLKVGTVVTRTGIRDYLKWDNKQYTRVIKPVCDKHHIG